MKWVDEIETKVAGATPYSHSSWNPEAFYKYVDELDVAKLIAAVRVAEKELTSTRFILCGNKDVLPQDILEGALRYNAHNAVRNINQTLAQLRSGEFGGDGE